MSRPDLSKERALEIYGVACPVCKLGALRWINYGQAQCAMCNVTVGATIAGKSVERDRYKTRCESLERDLQAVMNELNTMVEQNGRFRDELGLPR